MKLKKILKNISIEEVKGSKDVEITGICSHSKLVSPGSLFVAKKGAYIAEAVSAGAVALVTDIYDPFLKNIVQVIHPDPAKIEAELAENYYEGIHHKLRKIGVTGTNGKTTTTFLIKHLLDELDSLCGVIGTIEWSVGKQTLPSTHTTPDVMMNHKLFCEMVHNQCQSVAMEVSSHALMQGRIEGFLFDVAVFTNLTQDHLDYHSTMEEYAAAKARLFTSHAKKGVMNADSEWSAWMVQGSTIPTLTYGIHNASDLKADHLVLTPKGMEFRVCFEKQYYQCKSGLIGRFNVYNCLAAMGALIASGFSLEKVLPLLARFKQVPGRLERVPNKANLNIFVDYAHTEDALYNVLETLSEIKQGKLITVFGCGGDRDKLKRPKMAAVAEKFSDITILTSDNPRSEDPEAIIRDALVGCMRPEHVIVEKDRKLAIEKAIGMASTKDIVLIAGKGHETYQIFAHHTDHFDDREVAMKAVEGEFRARHL